MDKDLSSLWGEEDKWNIRYKERVPFFISYRERKKGYLPSGWAQKDQQWDENVKLRK